MTNISKSLVLVDTSAWIDFFRNRQGPCGDTLSILLHENRAVLCGVVEMELLAGLRPPEKKVVLPLLAALPYAQVEQPDWQATGVLLFSLRQNGVTIPATDALIATVALRLAYGVFTQDQHFKQIPNLELL